jgi:glycosyltransferase involved in cell wall biosynthesis
VTRRIVINGRFLTQPVTGVQRYARELVAAIAGIVDRDPAIARSYCFEILCPIGTVDTAILNSILIRAIGRFAGQVWEQVELPQFADGDLLLNFANTGPITYSHQIVTIHDASVFAAPAGYSLPFRLWYRVLHRRLVNTATVVVTDSVFSRRELEKHCGLDPERCRVISLGAEHILRNPADYSIIDRLGLRRGSFVLCAGSLHPNKNLVALRETATELDRRGMLMVVAGGGNARVFQTSSIEFPQNVLYTGYVTDAQLRALYESAACFAFPSLYEGFGLPPLEAMACGCPVVSSNAASLPEVCGPVAVYCDPRKPAEFASAVLGIVDNSSESRRLSETGKAHATGFRWEKTAREWLTLLDSISL